MMMSCYGRQQERGDNNGDCQCLQSNRHAIWRETGVEVELRESYSGRVALSSLETSTPIALKGTQDAKCSGMRRSGKT